VRNRWILDHKPQTVPVATSCGGGVPEVPVDHPQGKAKAKARSRKKPRIDIDNQITEANRLSAVLRRVAQAAKTTAKNGTRIKRRLVLKAGKLSSEDLERIAVLKRCGLFNGGIQDAAQHAESTVATSASAETPDKDCLYVHAKLAGAMSNIPGATGLFKSFGQGKVLRSKAPADQSSSSGLIRGTCAGAVIAGGGNVIVAQPLPPAAALGPSAKISCLEEHSLNSSDVKFPERSPSEEVMEDDEPED
jgi:hypothetical protein